jgi:hypothetical protein
MAELNALCLAHGLQLGGEKAALVAWLEEFDRAEDALVYVIFFFPFYVSNY